MFKLILIVLVVGILIGMGGMFYLVRNGYINVRKP